MTDKVERWVIWRELYEVSNMGRARRAAPGVNTHVGRILRPSPTTCGYLHFGPQINGKRVNAYVHHAVTEAFLGPRPAGLVVNHKDGCKTNNRIENLEYVTYSANHKHALAMGLSKPAKAKPAIRGDKHWTRRMPDRVKRGVENGAHLHPEAILRGESCPNSKLTEAQVIEIRALHLGGRNASSLGRQFNCSHKNVLAIVKRETWRHIP